MKKVCSNQESLLPTPQTISAGLGEEPHCSKKQNKKTQQIRETEESEFVQAPAWVQMHFSGIRIQENYN